MTNLKDLCPICKIRVKKNGRKVGAELGEYCIACDIEKEAEKRVKKRVERVAEIGRDCKICKNYFTSSDRKEKECRECITHRSIRLANEMWLNRKPVKEKKRQDANTIAYAFFKKKHEVPITKPTTKRKI